MPKGIIIATGSEVELAFKAKEELAKRSNVTSVEAMPTMELFDQQSQESKNTIHPPSVDRRISVEAESTFGWGKYVGLKGCSIGIDTFGASGNGDQVEEYFGFKPATIVDSFERLWNQ